MLLKTSFTVTFAAFAAAAPSAKYFGVGLEFQTSPLGEPAVLEPAPVQINKLANVHGVSASKITFDKNGAVGVDINSVECRAYKDAAGVVPGSAPFTYKKPALLSTNLVEVGSVLCYIV